MIDVVIDETGIVQAASITQSVTRQYDVLALAAAKTWRYRPAMLNGVPVRYRKAVQISVRPQGRRSQRRHNSPPQRIRGRGGRFSPVLCVLRVLHVERFVTRTAFGD
jgi:TonB family protein